MASSMGLLDLPLELFQAVVEETVWCLDFHGAVQLRLVSSEFRLEER